MTALLDRWFLTPIHPVRMALCRIMVSIVAIDWLIFGGRLYGVPRDLSRMPSEFIEPLSWSWPLFAVFPAGPPDWLLDGLRYGLFVGFALLLVGLRTRVVTIVVIPCALAYFGVGNSYGAIYSLNIGLYIAMLVGLFSDWGAALSLDARRQGGAPGPSARFGLSTRLTHAMVGLLFFFAALKKVIAAPMWVTGGQLWRYLVERNFIDRAGDDPWFRLWLIDHPSIVRLLELSTLAFESTFFLSFFIPRLAPLYV
ncbi:MAG: hypothetical protein ABL955_07150, partial [Elusimicrobiota bacterium]